MGQKVLDKAMTAAGVPYAWGGGSCAGATHDEPPYEYGDIGYDCSGLVCWALCQVTGRDLFTEGLRVTSSMYCASESTLGYKYGYHHLLFLEEMLTNCCLKGNTPTLSARLVMLSSLAVLAIAATARVFTMLGL